MAKKKKEEVVEKTTNEPKGQETKGDVTKVKEKMTMKPKIVEETITKVDLSKSLKTETDAVQERKTEEVPVGEPSGHSKEVVEGDESKQETPVQKEEPVQDEGLPTIEEVTNEKVTKVVEKVEKAIEVAEQTGEELPESIQKLVTFMNETGGDINDYVTLSQDYSELDNQTLLQEYYKQTKPHLNQEEISFLMEDQFSYDEEIDEERDIKRKKLALKEQVADAKGHLDDLKSKYYEDIKAGSKLTTEQQKAIDFFNRHNKESEETKQLAEKTHSNFLNKTDQVFNDEFKGFEYAVGDKKFRFNVNDANKVKDDQSDFGNFVGKFLNEDKQMEDAKGYHKGLFTAMNADAVASHFYEQGKADAIKTSVEKGKNIDMEPRQAHGEVTAGGITVRVLGDDSNDFKFKIKQK